MNEENTNNKDIIPYNDKGQRHGYWEFYFNTGQLMYRCFYSNGNANGFAEQYCWTDGKVTEKTYYL